MAPVGAAASDPSGGHAGDTGIIALAIVGGVLAWVAVLLPTVLDPQLRVQSGWPWFTLMVAYLVVFLADTVVPLSAVGERVQAAALLLIGLTVMALPPVLTTTPILTVTTTVVVAAVLPLAWTLGVVALQMLVVVWVVGGVTSNPEAVLIWVAAYTGFQLFAVVLVHLQGRADRARRALDTAHAELRARHDELARAQADLAEATREAERLRIARDLHDTMGHQLTALALNLEALSHVTADTPAGPPTAECRDLARGLLTEVRGVVGGMREPGPDLAARLRRLTTSSPLPAGLVVEDVPSLTSPQADAVYHGVQEALTNAARHPSATRAEVTVRGEDGELVMRIVDDGPGSSTPPIWGNGLTGMNERFAALGGIVTVATAPGEGFRVVGRLPLDGTGTT